jgi:transposase
MARVPYSTDVTDEEWAFVVTYLTLMKEDAPQREHELREVYNDLRWLVQAGAPWQMIPHDLPPWHAVYDQAQRWLAAGVFAAMAHDRFRTACDSFDAECLGGAPGCEINTESIGSEGDRRPPVQ